MKFFNLYDSHTIMTTIESEGIVFFENFLTENEFSSVSKLYGTIYTHRDSKEHGITIVSNSIEEKETKEGFKGLTSSELFPHTDKSTIQNPPNLLLLYCHNQSGLGGETTIVDTKKVLEKLLIKYGDSCPIFSSKNAIFCDGKDSYKGNIFEILEDGSCFLRFRNDKYGYFNSELISILPEFYKAIDEFTITLKLENNQGYLLNNGRFLHGRKSFSGNREMWRILLHDNFLNERGFKIRYNVTN